MLQDAIAGSDVRTAKDQASSVSANPLHLYQPQHSDMAQPADTPAPRRTVKLLVRLFDISTVQ